MHLALKFTLVGTSVAASFAHAALQDVPSFSVPSFDYPTIQDGNAPDRMLEALQRGGIIALKNIPNYTNVRERFLASAVECAVASENVEEGQRYLSTKQFNDGTRRLTLRSAAGRELLERERETLDAMAINCPGHRELHEAFSSALERAVDTFASVLDQTAFTMGDGERHISARKLVGDAKRLDHFHAYEAASTPSSSPRRSLSAQEIERDLSLAMHEDHGLFIAMSAPKFFSVNADGGIRERHLKSDASGLVIGAAELDEVVRPELKADELVIMMGTGASRWLETSHRLPAVMHGMRMPEEMVWDEETTPGQRNLRAWFGKMTLLPAYQRLLESKMDFDEFTNRTRRHLLVNGEDTGDDLKTIGCAGGRHLVESEGSCTFKICTLKPGVEKPPTVGCSQACNLDGEFFKAKCEKKCDCTGTTESDICWMICVARLPVDECPLENQACAGTATKIICKNSTDTNTNSTSAPAHTHTPTTETPLPTPVSPPGATMPSTSLPTVEPSISPSSTTAALVETLPATITPSGERAATQTSSATPASTKADEPMSGTPSPSATEAPSPGTTAFPPATEMPSINAPAEEPVVPGGYC